MSGLLPKGTVTLLLADVEGSTRLWETQPKEMTAALARFDQTVSEIIVGYAGVRPVEQGEGDSFVAAFPRASDAVACALSCSGPRWPRSGCASGCIPARSNCATKATTSAAINRTARLRDLAHGGQTVLSGATEELVAERLPPDAWLTDLGTHRLRDLPHPERVADAIPTL